MGRDGRSLSWSRPPPLSSSVACSLQRLEPRCPQRPPCMGKQQGHNCIRLAAATAGFRLQPASANELDGGPLGAKTHSPDDKENARTQIHAWVHTHVGRFDAPLFVIPFFSEERGLIEGPRRWLRRLKYIVGNLPASCFCILRTLYTAPRYVHTSGSKRSAIALSSGSHGVSSDQESMTAEWLAILLGNKASERASSPPLYCLREQAVFA